jgi:rubrerythrin
MSKQKHANDKACVHFKPTADVVEVRHGHWIEHIEKPSWLEDDVEVYYNCSECGTSHWSIEPPYCPECGARMDGERGEE